MLEALATKMLKQDDYFSELKKIGNSKEATGIHNAMNKLFDTVKTNTDQKTHDVIDKAKVLLRLIRSNTQLVKDSKNFNLTEMQDDLTTMQDIVFRIESINSFTKNQLQTMNRLHKQHSKINKIINE